MDRRQFLEHLLEDEIRKQAGSRSYQPEPGSRVTSRPIRAEPPRRGRSGTEVMLVVGHVGVWLAVLCFGSLFWAINGGFSVRGLEVVSGMFNEAGAVFWQVVSSLTFTVIVPRTGLVSVQPVIPWIGVLAASCVQVAVIYLSSVQYRAPVWLIVAAVLLSAYDLGTTFFGLRTVQWALHAGVVVQVILTVLITFLVEFSLSFILRSIRRR